MVPVCARGGYLQCIHPPQTHSHCHGASRPRPVTSRHPQQVVQGAVALRSAAALLLSSRPRTSAPAELPRQGADAALAAGSVCHDWCLKHLDPIGESREISSPETASFLVMPIFRQPTSSQPGSNQGFQSSVSSVPIAMSMMIDSMVNMVQNSRPDLKAETDSSTK